MKKIISLLMALCLLLSCTVLVSAAEKGQYVKQADALHALGLFQGTNNGYDLEKSMTREQGVVMIIRLLGKEEEAKNGDLRHPFTDTKNYTWVDPYLAYAYTNGITNGVSETEFGYGKPMSDAMFLTMLLRVLGYKDDNGGKGDFVWSDPYALAKTAGICDGSEVSPFLRDHMVLYCWNALAATLKGSTKKLYDTLISDGVFTKAAYEAAVKSVNGTDSSTTTGGTTGGGSLPIQPTRREYADTIQLSTDNAVLYVGSSTRLSVIFSPADVQNKTVSWSSSNPAVASVADGVVNALAEGTAVITASYHGMTATCNFVVNTVSSSHANETPRIPIV